MTAVHVGKTSVKKKKKKMSAVPKQSMKEAFSIHGETFDITPPPHNIYIWGGVDVLPVLSDCHQGNMVNTACIHF